jgi:hypothetical protein
MHRERPQFRRVKRTKSGKEALGDPNLLVETERFRAGRGVTAIGRRSFGCLIAFVRCH